MKAVRLLIWVGGGALCAGMTLALGPVDQPEIVKHRAVIYFTVSFIALTIGLLVWQRRPESRTGLLLTAFPLADVLSNGKWIFWNHSFPVTVAFASAYLYVPLFAPPDPLVSDGSTCDAARPLLRGVRIRLRRGRRTAVSPLSRHARSRTIGLGSRAWIVRFRSLTSRRTTSAGSGTRSTGSCFLWR